MGTTPDGFFKKKSWKGLFLRTKSQTDDDVVENFTDSKSTGYKRRIRGELGFNTERGTPRSISSYSLRDLGSQDSFIQPLPPPPKFKGKKKKFEISDPQPLIPCQPYPLTTSGFVSYIGGVNQMERSKTLPTSMADQNKKGPSNVKLRGTKSPPAAHLNVQMNPIDKKGVIQTDAPVIIKEINVPVVKKEINVERKEVPNKADETNLKKSEPALDSESKSVHQESAMNFDLSFVNQQLTVKSEPSFVKQECLTTLNETSQTLGSDESSDSSSKVTPTELRNDKTTFSPSRQTQRYSTIEMIPIYRNSESETPVMKMVGVAQFEDEKPILEIISSDSSGTTSPVSITRSSTMSPTPSSRSGITSPKRTSQEIRAHLMNRGSRELRSYFSSVSKSPGSDKNVTDKSRSETSVNGQSDSQADISINSKSEETINIGSILSSSEAKRRVGDTTQLPEKQRDSVPSDFVSSEEGKEIEPNSKEPQTSSFNRGSNERQSHIIVAKHINTPKLPAVKQISPGKGESFLSNKLNRVSSISDGGYSMYDEPEEQSLNWGAIMQRSLSLGAKSETSVIRRNHQELTKEETPGKFPLPDKLINKSEEEKPQEIVSRPFSSYDNHPTANSSSENSRRESNYENHRLELSRSVYDNIL